ncbi:hypothetical protein [Mycobacterium sp. NPDC050853]|uniref:hypothetical protein n=1 Tax=Mycobacterium sp. NPDC050853 TaxID=3155160 RepID=UPI0033F8DD25
MSKFGAPRPDHLPISAEVWDMAQRYEPTGPTVFVAMYEALQKLEAEVVALRDARTGHG